MFGMFSCGVAQRFCCSEDAKEDVEVVMLDLEPAIKQERYWYEELVVQETTTSSCGVGSALLGATKNPPCSGLVLKPRSLRPEEASGYKKPAAGSHSLEAKATLERECSTLSMKGDDGVMYKATLNRDGTTLLEMKRDDACRENFVWQKMPEDADLDFEHDQKQPMKRELSSERREQAWTTEQICWNALKQRQEIDEISEQIKELNEQNLEHSRHLGVQFSPVEDPADAYRVVGRGLVARLLRSGHSDTQLPYSRDESPVQRGHSDSQLQLPYSRDIVQPSSVQRLKSSPGLFYSGDTTALVSLSRSVSVSRFGYLAHSHQHSPQRKLHICDEDLLLSPGASRMTSGEVVDIKSRLSPETCKLVSRLDEQIYSVDEAVVQSIIAEQMATGVAAPAQPPVVLTLNCCGDRRKPISGHSASDKDALAIAVRDAQERVIAEANPSAGEAALRNAAALRCGHLAREYSRGPKRRSTDRSELMGSGVRCH